jgi:Amt family ammonium transporter
MPPLPDSGSEAWVLTSMALVQLMTPGVSFFYAGLSQGSSQSTLMMCLGCMSLITLLWSLVGFSLAFGESIPSGVLGGLQYSTLDQITADTNVQWARAPAITTRTFSMFHLMLAMLTSGIICGSLVDKIKYHYFLLFSGAWHLLVYCPLAHHVFFPGGWLAQYGVLDFAGGLVVHTASGTSALVFSLWLSTMSSFSFNLNSVPHWQPRTTGKIPFVLFGTFLLWYGWLGLTGGSALSSASYSAGLAATNTQLGGAAGLMTWHLMEVLRSRGWPWDTGHPTAMGACTGVVTGLVAITPGAGYVSPMWSVATAVAAVALAYLTLALLRRVRVLRRVNDSLDCFAIHGVAGMVGTLLTGLLADTRQSGLAGASGAAFGSPMQLARQAVGILAVLAISILGTTVIFWALWLLAWARRDRLEDVIYELGAELESYQHGEAAYSTDSGGLEGTMMEGASGRRGGGGGHSSSRGQRAAAGSSGGNGRGIAAQSRRAQWRGGSEAGAGSRHKPSLPELMPVGLRDSGEERAPAPALKLDVVVEGNKEEITLGGQQTEVLRVKHEEVT